MNDDFFESMKQTITDTMEAVTKKTNDLVETQKLHAKIKSTQQAVKENYRKLGELVYARYVAGELADEELAEICDEVAELQTLTDALREELAEKRRKNICAACGFLNPKEASFCMHCGNPIEKESGAFEDDMEADAEMDEDVAETEDMEAEVAEAEVEAAVESAEDIEQEIMDACTDTEEEEAKEE